MKTTPKKTAAQVYEARKTKLKKLPESVTKMIEEFKLNYLTADAVQEMYTICRTTLYNYRCKGLDTYSTSNRRIYFKLADVIALLGPPKKTGSNNTSTRKAA